MNSVKQALNQARLDLNEKIQKHYAGTGQTPDFDSAEFDGCIAEDGHSLVLFVQFPDGFTATAGSSSFVDRFHASAREVH